MEYELTSHTLPQKGRFTTSALYPSVKVRKIGLEDNRISQFRARAFENMVGVAMTNYAAPQENGHSVAFDGVAFGENGARDTLIIEAGESEGVYLAEFDMDRIRAYREREAWGNAYRKPRCYDLLTSLEVEKPFIRVSARR